MFTLSPKAMRFIAIAMDRTDDQTARAIWSALDHDVQSGLPAPAARAALETLRRFEQEIRARLEGGLGEDEASDLSNDLGFVYSIESDLEKHLKHRAAKRV